MEQRSVSFDSAGLRLAGTLYVPDTAVAGPRPAIVVSHPASGVKEQTAGLYARHLAEQGLMALAFDAAYGGESEGEPRGLEDPAHRVEDIRAAISFLSVYEGIDPARLGLLGICASGGYATAAAATDCRVKALATVSGTDLGTFFREGHDGKQAPELLRALLHNAAKARTAEARGDGVQRFAIFPESEADARRLGPYAYEGWEYYCTPRAEHPRSTRMMPWSSVDRIAAFDGFGLVRMVAPRPVLMIAGTRAETRWMTEAAFDRAGTPKTLQWVEGASHVDLYDKAEYVRPAVAMLAAFYKEHLSQ